MKKKAVSRGNNGFLPNGMVMKMGNGDNDELWKGEANDRKETNEGEGRGMNTKSTNRCYLNDQIPIYVKCLNTVSLSFVPILYAKCLRS